MSATISPTQTTVQAYEDLMVTIDPGQPWPGVYRGSKYSLTGKPKDPQLEVTHKGIKVSGEVPKGIVDEMKAVQKSGGTGLGTFRVTADNHVLTKVHADNYPYVEEAPVQEGWIPVYLGKISGEIQVPGFDNNPDGKPVLWTGLCFQHGERWTVTAEGILEWRYKKSQSFHFPSNDNHNDLVSAYRRVRKVGGRLRINEFGHIWMDAPRETVRQFDDLYKGVQQWLKEKEEEGRNELLSLIYKRLERTGGGDPSSGNFPLYVGHVSDYDHGVVPVPQVNDPSYYRIAGGDADKSK